MNYIVLDMEWNQGYPGQIVCIRDTRRALTGEIIQIGAVKLDESFRIVDRYVRQVRPIFYPKLHHRVKELTKITPDELKNAEPFTNVFPDFLAWCGEPFCFLIWGLDDIAILRQNLEANDIVAPHETEAPHEFEWFNLQTIYNRQIGSENRQTALQTACETLHIEQELPLHNALNDAEYTARICERMDMAAGIAYCREQKQNGTPNGKKKAHYYGFSTPEEALDFARNTDNTCPFCQKELSLSGRYVRKYVNQYAALRLCEEHGCFVENVAVSRIDEKSEKSLYKLLKTVAHAESREAAARQVTKTRRRHRRKGAAGGEKASAEALPPQKENGNGPFLR